MFKKGKKGQHIWNFGQKYKGQVIALDYCMQWTDRKAPACSVSKICSHYYKKWFGRFEQVIMADKKGKTKKNATRWAENELELLAEVLADLENNFDVSLEWFAIKKSANNEVFQHITNTFEMEIDNKVFKQINADQVKGNAINRQTIAKI